MEEIILKNKKHGMAALIVIIAIYALAIVGMVFGAGMMEGDGNPVLFIVSFVVVMIGWVPAMGLKILKPQEALVLTLFGKYVGTLKGEGFYFVNPFCSSVNPAAKTKLNQSGDVNSGAGEAVKAAANAGISMNNNKISLKIMTLNNNRQKINDCLGNPVEIGIADEGSLRGSSEVVASRIKDEIQKRVEEAGLEVIEARITYLAYAPEIAAVMLQRQQASAIIDARKMIVDGAVGMVEMALERLSENSVVELDEERKAAMVSNLLVVLCGNHDAQPVVNSGSLY